MYSTPKLNDAVTAAHEIGHLYVNYYFIIIKKQYLIN